MRGEEMAKMFLRKPTNPQSLLYGWNQFRDEKIKSLCTRLGVEFTSDPTKVTEMWAQIGDYLALDAAEFQRPQTRGRPKKETPKEITLALKVQDLQELSRRDGKILTDRDAIQILIGTGTIPTRDMSSMLSQVSRGRRDIEQFRFWGGNEDDYTEFEIMRTERDALRQRKE